MKIQITLRGKQLPKRIVMSLFGVIICAMSVGLFKLAALGVDPFQSLLAGLDSVVPISYGTLSVVANVVLLVFSLIADRHNIGIATFINMFLFGYIAQFTLELLQIAIPEPALWLRWIFLLVAIVVMCFGSAFYMTATLGVSTYDAVAIVFAYKWKWGKFRYIRIATDFVCVAAGILIFILGGGEWSGVPAFVGAGTIVTAFFMGPLIEFFNKTVAVPFLTGRKKKASADAANV